MRHLNVPCLNRSFRRPTVGAAVAVILALGWLGAVSPHARAAVVKTGAVLLATNAADPSVSSDGTKLVYVDGVRNAGDVGPIYVEDTKTGNRTLVSQAGSHPKVSADGSTVSFESATSLSQQDQNSLSDVYVATVGTGGVTLASSADGATVGNGNSWSASLSANGSRVAFLSAATNLDARDGDASPDVYVKDLSSGKVTVASTSADGVKANGPVTGLSLSADGTLVAFATTSTNLDKRDGDSTPDVYVKNLATGALTLASVNGAGVKGNGSNDDPSLSGDGHAVAFQSFSSNLSPSDTEGAEDEFGQNVYVKDLVSGTLTLPTLFQSSDPSLSADGTKVAYTSGISGQDPTDLNLTEDVYLTDLSTGATTFVSTGPTGTIGNDASTHPSLSGDGTTVAFASSATNLSAMSVGASDVFARGPAISVPTPYAQDGSTAPHPATTSDTSSVTNTPTTPYVTLLFGRTQWSEQDPSLLGCQKTADAKTLIDVATELQSRGMTGVGNTVPAYTPDTGINCQGTTFMYPGWDKLATLKATYNWSFVSAGQTYDGWKNNVSTAAQAQAESCGSKQAFRDHQHYRWWGLFAYPNDDIKFTGVVTNCFAYGRKYGDGLNYRYDSDPNFLNAPDWLQRTAPINGGGGETQDKYQYVDPSAYVNKIASLGPNYWYSLQAYRFRTGDSFTQKCSGSADTHYTFKTEEYCWVDYLTILDALQANTNARTISPANVACNWGRGNPNSDALTAETCATITGP